MSKRALILWACLGTLLFSAAKMSADLDPERDGPTAMMSSLDGEARTPNFDLLSAAYGPSSRPVKTPSLLPSTIDESTLWLARAIFSETKIPHEQELVAWVVRNRVETGYRGSTTYKGAVLDPYQFSAFNPGAPKRTFLLSLTPEVERPAWQRALWIAHYVRRADAAYRPFSIQTRHFYSERSMSGRRHPYWVQRHHFVSPGLNYTLNERRFRFYKEIS